MSLLWCCIISGFQLASVPPEKGRRLKELCGEDMADFEMQMRKVSEEVIFSPTHIVFLNVAFF
jgi:hypothetical protein